MTSITGEVPLKVGGQNYTLLLKSYAIAQIERILDISMFELAVELEDPTKRRLRTIGVALWSALLTHHPEMTEREAFALIDDGDKEYVLTQLGKAMQAAFPEAKAGDKNPPKPNRKTRRATKAKAR